MSELASRVTLLKGEPDRWPEDYEEILLEALREEQNLRTRLTATVVMNNYFTVNDEIVDALLALVPRRDLPKALRVSAAGALGTCLEACAKADRDGADATELLSRSTLARIYDRLKELYFDPMLPGDVKQILLVATATKPQEWHPEAVRAAYAREGRLWKGTAVSCMKFVPGFEREILESLLSEHDEVRIEAVIAAGAWALDAAWPSVVQVLNTPDVDQELLSAAIHASVKLRPAEALPLLERFKKAGSPRRHDCADSARHEAHQARGDDDEVDTWWKQFEKFEVSRKRHEDDEGGGLLN